jgi:hypothetical protein
MIKRYFQSRLACLKYACTVTAFNKSFRRTIVAIRASGRVVGRELPLLQRAISSVIIRSISFIIPLIFKRKVTFCNRGSQLLRLRIARLYLHTAWRVRIYILTSIVTSLISRFTRLDLESVSIMRRSYCSENTT